MSETRNTSPATMVHCAITLKVREGKEAEFETGLQRFVRESLGFPGTTGVHLIRPAPGTGSREYGILRSFQSAEYRDRFYQSEMFQQYKADTVDLVDGDPVIRPLHGLEAFFRGGNRPPPRWKMALLTWLVVYPAVLVWSAVWVPQMQGWHPAVVTAVVSVCVVITLAWGVMPWLTQILRPWLQQH